MTEQSLLEAVLAEPDYLLARQVLADWHEDHGVESHWRHTPADRRIDAMTPEQERLLPVFRDHWLRLGLWAGETTAAHKAEAERWAGEAYKVAGLEPPKIIVWLDSPLGGAIGAAILAQVWAQVGDQVWAQVRGQVWAQVRDQVRGQVGDQVRDQVRGSDLSLRLRLPRCLLALLLPGISLPRALCPPATVAAHATGVVLRVVVAFRGRGGSHQTSRRTGHVGRQTRSRRLRRRVHR